jgi:hypothetical protein
MASVTLNGERFPAGTSVSAYTRADFPAMPVVPSGVPSGPVAVSTATVGTDGTLTFTGLADDTKYVAYAQVSGQDRYVQFRSAPLVGSGSGGVVGVLDVSVAPYLADRTGATDASAAIQAAIDAAALAVTTTGTVKIPAGLYRLTTPLRPKSGVEIIGAGVGRTILKPIGSISAITPVNLTDFTAAAPLTDAVFRDFEIDGSLQTVPGGVYTSAVKGIYIQHHKRVHYLNLYIHDTAATGLGVDHFYEGCLIERVQATGCGRLNSGSDPGGSGIGIGSIGDSGEQPLTISNCWALNNKRFGIFVESQTGSITTAPSGARIIGCWAKGNQVGIGEAGNRRTVIVGNSCSNNTVAGIAASPGTFGPGQPGIDNIIQGNNCYLNAIGILLDYTGNDTNGKTSVADNECNFNDGHGIAVKADTVSPGAVTIAGNITHDNGRCGIKIYYGGTTNTASFVQGEITSNVVFNNGTLAAAGDRDGIRIALPCTDVRVKGNRCYDRQGTKTQDYGVVVTATFTGGSIVDNDLRGNKTGSASLTGTISATTGLGSNLGHTPPAPAVVTVTASPFTYTAGATPEVLRIFGGTVSGVTQGGTTVADSTGSTLLLEPGDAVVVTYSSAPTITSRRSA